MDILDKKTDEELIKSILAEIAKASNELRCAHSDLKKANSRLSFLLVVANKLIERQGD
jgi:flagellar hook-basal body complex protein FliE